MLWKFLGRVAHDLHLERWRFQMRRRGDDKDVRWKHDEVNGV